MAWSMSHMGSWAKPTWRVKYLMDNVIGQGHWELLPTLALATGGATLVSSATSFANSQVLGVALTRYVLRLPPVAAMPSDELVRWVGPTLQRYFTAQDPGASVSGRSRT